MPTQKHRCGLHHRQRHKRRLTEDSLSGRGPVDAFRGVRRAPATTSIATYATVLSDPRCTTKYRTEKTHHGVLNKSLVQSWTALVEKPVRWSFMPEVEVASS